MARQDVATLYREVGGHETVAAVVDLFYRRVLADDQLAGFFADIDLEALRRHQAAFIDRALDGPGRYRGRAIREAQRGLRITAPQFERMLGHLAAALRECAVPEAPAAAIISRLAALRDDVIEQ